MRLQLNTYLLLIFGLSCLNCQNKDEINIDYNVNLDSQISHDLNLPNWGPYTKKYVGISHIPNVEKGLRYDLSIFPTVTGQKSPIPDVLKQGNFHIWEASPDLKYFSYRHQLEWKDKVYADISYSFVDDNSRSIILNLINTTNSNKSLDIHMISSMHFPPLEPYKPDNEILIKKLELPENAIWVEALDYKTYTYNYPEHRDRLIYNGMLRAEVRENGLINGNAIEFAKQRGDKVVYEFELPQSIENPVLYIRYKSLGDKNAIIGVSGSVNTSFEFEKTTDFVFKEITLGQLTDKNIRLEFDTKSSSKVLVDGFAVLNQNEINKVKVSDVNWNPAPEIINSETPNSFILKYENTDVYYGLYWGENKTEINDFPSGDLPENFNTTGEKDSLSTTSGFLKDVILRPVVVKPNSTKVLHAYVCSGDLEQVKQNLKTAKDLDYKKIQEEARKHLHSYNVIPDGEKFLFSQQRMMATTFSNVVYPIYTQNQYIRHSTPGRKWDCLYTWDSGFIGIGLNQLDTERSIENLNAYLNFPEEQSAFIHHGTPLPVQFYQFLEIWNKTQSEEFLEEVYPKLKYYYDFLARKIKTSTTNNLNSGLIRTWDYFYNSGGWDDYPAQVYMHDNKLTKVVTPSVSTAHLIRAAKIMELASRHLQKLEDFETYQKDIEIWANALNKYAWDENSGYYGYLLHSGNGNPKEILKYNDEVNYNMGLDGVSPIISGIADKNQTQKMMSNLTTKGKIWSDVGLSTVDQSAPYYNKSGYWNGHVWMPHQWFFWKAMLDLGETDFAYKISDTALNVWKRETETTYNSNEYFSIETGQGKGWYQFSGLSTPVLSWFTSYYEIGTFTTGFDVWVMKRKFNQDFSGFEAQVRLLDKNDKPFSVILCLNPDFSYDAYWNDKKVPVKEIHKGTLSISLKRDTEIGNLLVVKK